VHPVFLKGIGDHPAGDKMPAASGRRGRGEIEKMVLKALSEGKNLSTNEVAAVLGYKKTTDTLRSVVDSLIKAGKLAYLYPDKPRSRNQKLCLL
jgi:ATP-dependent DNA helicase RecG